MYVSINSVLLPFISGENFTTKLNYWIKCAIGVVMFHLTMSNLNMKLYQLNTFLNFTIYIMDHFQIYKKIFICSNMRISVPPTIWGFKIQ